MNIATHISLTFCFAFLVLGSAHAQRGDDPYRHANKFSAGLFTGHYGYNPAAGMEITTPAFREHFSIRFRGSLQGLEVYKSYRGHWISYQSFSAGITYHSRISESARFFVEAGGIFIIPDSRFSDETFLRGYYEFNGLEVFFLNTSRLACAFYLGVGPTFIKAYADKLEGAPRYGNGILYLSGLRCYF